MILKSHRKIIMDCALPTDTIIIRLLGNNQIAIAHCGMREAEVVNPLSFDEVYKMSSDEFWNYLQDSYKKIPENHKWEPDYYCNTKNKICVYNDKYIRKVVVSTSKHCNIHCKMCMVSSNTLLKPDEDKKLYFNILEKLKNHGIFEIGLTHNGEPFLYKQQAFDYIESLKPKIDCSQICITTNAILLNDDDILRLETRKKNNMDIFLMVSCCAISRETYKTVHGSDSFIEVEKNIIELNRRNLLSCISFVIQKENIHELEFLKDYWYSKGVKVPFYARIIVGFDGNEIAKMKEYQDFLKIREELGPGIFK